MGVGGGLFASCKSRPGRGRGRGRGRRLLLSSPLSFASPSSSRARGTIGFGTAAQGGLGSLAEVRIPLDRSRRCVRLRTSAAGWGVGGAVTGCRAHFPTFKRYYGIIVHNILLE